MLLKIYDKINQKWFVLRRSLSTIAVRFHAVNQGDCTQQYPSIRSN